MPAPPVINPAPGRPIRAPFLPNKCYTFVVFTDGVNQRTGFVELAPNSTLSRDSTGTLQNLPVGTDGLSLPPSALPAATIGAAGVTLKSAALVAPAQAALVNNTGGSLITTLPAIVGAVYATDAPAIKNAISTLTVALNVTNARLEDLIAKLKTAGVQT